MGTSKQHGFTILETILFLGVTGVLIAVLMVGAGSSLNAQRYRDATQSFRNLLQARYAELSSVVNARDDNRSCDSNAVVSDSGNEFRGHSDCTLVGRYVSITGSDIHVYTVLARQNPSPIGGLNDVTSLRNNYSLSVSSTDVEEKYLDWGTSIAWPRTGKNSGGAEPRDIGILFIRSPDSGNIYTFSSDNTPSNPDSVPQSTFDELLVGTNTVPGRAERTICVVSDGLISSGDTAIFIKSYATSASAIETRSNEYAKSLEPIEGPNASQC